MPWWFWHLFTAIGITMLTAGAFVLRDELRFAVRAQPATGTVIGYSQHQDLGDDTWMYAPIVQFATKAGETVEFSSELRSTSRTYELGQKTNVLYDPAQPKHAKLSNAGARFFAPVILLFLAAVFTALGVFGQMRIGRGLAGQG